METEALVNVNSKIESPNFPVIELKLEPKEENDSQFDELEVASQREHKKYINFYEKFDGEDRKDDFNESNPLGTVIEEREKLDEINCDLKSETIALEEIHIKDEADEDKLNKKTQKSGDHQCPQCPYRTIFKCYLKSHQITHKRPDEIDWFVCQECSYKTARKGSLKRHADIHNNLMLKCSKCSYETLRAVNLKKHQVKHEMNLQWLQCSECSYKTHVKWNFRKHSLIRHKRDAFKCDKCPYQTGRKDLFTIHQVKHEKLDKWYSCSICSFKTPGKNWLRMHYQRRHSCDPNNLKQIETFKCTECSYESGCRLSVKNHQLGHDPSNWLQCPDCAYKTLYKYALKQHQVRHQGENAEGWLRCMECPYKTPYKKCLQSHILSHNSGEEIRRFKCSQCSFKTAYKRGLRQHQLKHKEAHEVEWFYCYECSYKTNRKWHLVGHISTHKKQIKR